MTPFHVHPHAPGHGNFMADHPIRAMYLGDTIRSFGTALFSVFAPIYLFTLFKAANVFAPAAWVFLYVAAYWVVAITIMYHSLKVYPALGFKWVAILSAIATGGHVIFLILAETHGVSYLVPAVFLGALGSGIFWPAYHILFARSASSGHRGQAIGTRSALMKTASLIAPALGGFIIAKFGFAYVLWAFLLIRLVAVIPYAMIDMRDGHRGGIRPLLRELKHSAGRKTGLGFASWGVTIILAAYAWPILLAELGVTYQQLGLLVTGASLITIVTLYVFGKYTDGHDRRRILKRSSAMYAGSWLLRLLSGGVWSAFTADTLAQISGGISAIPIDSQAYDRLSEEPPNEQVHLIMLREVGINGGKILGGILIAMLLFSGLPVRAVLGAAIPAALVLPLAITWGRSKTG